MPDVPPKFAIVANRDAETGNEQLLIGIPVDILKKMLSGSMDRIRINMGNHMLTVDIFGTETVEAGHRRIEDAAKMATAFQRPVTVN